MQQDGPSSNMLMTQAVLFWIIAYWLGELANGEPMTFAMSALSATVAMLLAVMSATRAVLQTSPFHSKPGQVIWALRPRKWMITWAVIVILVVSFGKPMFLWNYGGGQCQYIDWWFQAHWLPAQGDGTFRSCRFLSSW